MDTGAPDSCLWRETAGDFPVNPPLRDTVGADVLIIGAGYTGLSCALHLAQAGVDVSVIESQSVGFGGSGRNVGLVNAGLWLPPDTVEARLGQGPGGRLNACLAGGPQRVFDLIHQHGIECEARRNGTLHLAHSRSGFETLRVREAQWRSRDAPVSLLSAADTRELLGSSRYQGALLDERAGTIQPLSYARGLARAALSAGARLYEATEALEATRAKSGWRVTTAMGVIQAKNVVLATNAYSGERPGLCANDTFPIHFFQVATAPMPDVQYVLRQEHGAWDTQLVMTSVRRDAAGRIIIGSVGRLATQGDARFHRWWAERVLRRLFPDLGRIEFGHAWSGRIAFTPDHLPRIVRYGHNLFAVLGYNGRGIAPGTVFGESLARYLITREEGDLPLTITAGLSVGARRSRSLGYELAARSYHLLFG